MIERMAYRRFVCSMAIGACLSLGLVPHDIRPARAAERPAKKYALVVGVREYREGQPLPELPYTEPDAEQLGQVLERGGYSVTVMTQSVGGQKGKFGQLPTADNIRDKLEGILGNPFLAEEDTVLLALAGHGVLLPVTIDDKGTLAERFFFCPMDADVAPIINAAKEKRFSSLSELRKERHLVSLDELYASLDTQCKAGLKLMLVDSCRNDPTKNTGSRALESVTLPPLPDPPGGVAAFFSCSKHQQAKEDPDLKHGVFFNYVIEGLNGAADYSKDGKVTLSELNEYVGGAVYDFVFKKYKGARQVPELKGVIRGQMALLTVVSGGRDSWEGTKAGQLREAGGSKLVWIPPGEFTMGSTKEEKFVGFPDYEKQVEVTLSKGFWLGQHKVTQSEWRRVMQTWPWSGQDFVKEGKPNDYPATYVSWEDAMKFCEKLTEQERTAGLLPEGWSYTLPTEAQWEYACRAGTRSRFSFGEDESDLGDYAWFKQNAWDAGEKYAHRVAQKKANPWGLFDMHGNVSEWCRDWYAKELSGGTDPQGPSTGSLRVSRGAYVGSTAWECRSAHRSRNNGHGGWATGFRLAAVQSVK
jgi:sulfatase modifying factor 1